MLITISSIFDREKKLPVWPCYVCAIVFMQIDIEADELQGKKSLHHIPGCEEFEMADWYKCEKKNLSCHRSS
jgi:hypothetical protein